MTEYLLQHLYADMTRRHENPKLIFKIKDAVNPKALTIAAAPANPIAFPMIMGAAMGAPETIPGLIGLKVTAND